MSKINESHNHLTLEDKKGLIKESLDKTSKTKSIPTILIDSKEVLYASKEDSALYDWVVNG